MDSNSLLAFAFAGVLIMCLGLIVALTLVVRILTGSTSVEAKPRRKIFLRPGAPSSTPNLVKPPTEKTEAEPMAGPNGVTHIDKTNKDEYRELHEVPRSLLSEAVEAYMQEGGDGKKVVGAVIDEVEREK